MNVNVVDIWYEANEAIYVTVYHLQLSNVCNAFYFICIFTDAPDSCSRAGKKITTQNILKSKNRLPFHCAMQTEQHTFYVLCKLYYFFSRNFCIFILAGARCEQKHRANE